MTPPILARVAQLHGSSEEADCNTISTTTSWEYVSKSSSLSDLTRLGTAFLSPSSSNHTKQDVGLGAQSSTNAAQNQLGRSLLPLGIVPLPTYKHAHSNGFHPHMPYHGYRLTQKDLLQPSSNGASNGTAAQPLISSGHMEAKKDSNPVMRSTSFNLDYGSAAAKKQNLKYRQPANPNRPGRHSQSQLSTSGKPRQQAIVLVAENPESGQSDVYNVPFQSDIYSLPVDSILSASVNNEPKKPSPPSKVTSSSNSCASISQTNLNQRLKSETVTSNNAITPPPPRKSNLSRRTSCGSDTANEHGTKCIINLSSHSRDLPLQQPEPHPRQSSLSHVEEPAQPCKPPQRSTSLSVQPQPTVSNEIPTASNVLSSFTPPPPLPPAPSHRPRVTPPQPSLVEFKPVPPERTSASSSAVTTNKLTTSSKSNLALSSQSQTPNSSKTCVGSSSRNSSSTNQTGSSNVNASVKKPRSRSVDPGSELERQSHVRSSMKRTADMAYNLNIDDNPRVDSPLDLPLPLPPAESEHSLHNLFSSNKDSTTGDRRNPLGLSLLNLFRRNKGAPGPTNGTGSNGTSTGFKQSQQLQVKSEPDTSANSHQVHSQNGNNDIGTMSINNNKEDTSYYFRELPPPPPGQHSDESSDEQTFSPTASPLECRDFAASIEKVKDCGWYWGPLSSEAAEDLLKNEPDGSFIVRDSSDARYIFSLTFKLHGLVRHVRIEHDQGNFSFGPLTKFKAHTIVDFVEKAVAHSRSGRYLFFLHRRPVLGPMQVQLLHPYSRFMHPRSLKHMCRFVILKYVRKDLIHTLPLPKPMKDYLNEPHYYFEPPERIGGGGGNPPTVSTSHPPTRLV